MLPLAADTRRTDLGRMAETELDLLVVGGGIAGAGIALDAASRGLSVGLVEREDFASGTSGRSSRMVHGGARYLEHYDFGLVQQALRERVVILRLAPHLVRPVTMYAPTSSSRQQFLFRLGLTVYDTLALGRNLGRHRAVDAAELHRVAPGLGRPTRGVRYWECRTDDARLTLEAVRAAKRHGALVANHAEVTALIGEGRVRGARVLDHQTDEHLDVQARITVNATGVWADSVHTMAARAGGMLRPSKGVHLVFRPGAVDTRTALFVPSGAGDRRFVFVIPWGDRVYAGTTDTEYHGGLDDPAVEEADLEYVLQAVAAAFPGVTRDDVTATWAGLRPLLGGARGPTADLSRKHRIFEDPPGLLTITGGKLTTYRAMAEELVDRAARALGTGGRCRTRELPLGLTRPFSEALGRAMAEGTALGLPEASARRLVTRFGDDWKEALRLIGEDRSLGDPAVPGFPVLQVELNLARTREMALTDDDVLVRRTRLSTMDASVRLPAG
ncbi:MAG: glycerol-3-phosphate dehydrogenase/oxidase [Actinomycetota bacterium]|nr:glycerol-3-phosphate dehydrogenase/oxidase [Actinomycetota bacterium]